MPPPDGFDLLERIRITSQVPIMMLTAHGATADKVRAFEFLEKSYLQHSATLAFLKPDPFWDNLRSDPRYADLLRRMGLPQ